MIESDEFKTWLTENTDYSVKVVRDTVSRMKRADMLLEWNGEETYQFFLERCPEYQSLSVSVKSQLRRAVKWYMMFQEIAQKDASKESAD